MTDAFRPHLSEANRILPLLRERIVDTSMAHPLPKGLSIELVPIVEEGLFGFELETDRETHTYLIIGCNAQGAPVIREAIYDIRAPRALQLVTVHGQRLSRSDREARFRAQRHDSQFNDWPDAVEALWNRLSTLFPRHPRQPAAIPDARNRSLEGALSVAWTHLERWDPFIMFCGLPDEAELGFALGDATYGHGVLIYQRPDIWMLRWKAPPDAVYESWSVVVLPAIDVERNAGNGFAS
jgi:hypothetical protein